MTPQRIVALSFRVRRPGLPAATAECSTDLAVARRGGDGVPRRGEHHPAPRGRGAGRRARPGPWRPAACAPMRLRCAWRAPGGGQAGRSAPSMPASSAPPSGRIPRRSGGWRRCGTRGSSLDDRHRRPSGCASGAAEALVARLRRLPAGERGLNVGEARQALGGSAGRDGRCRSRHPRGRAAPARPRPRDRRRSKRRVRAQPPRRLEARVIVEAQAPFKGELTVTYAVRGARWTPVYDARLTTAGARPSLELVRRAEIRQQTGEDWSDVALTVSTVAGRAGRRPFAATGIADHPVSTSPALPGRLERCARRRRSAHARRRLPAPPPRCSPPRMRPRTGAGRVAEARGGGRHRRLPGQLFVIPGTHLHRRRVRARGHCVSPRATIEPQLISRAVPSVDPTAFLGSQVQACRGRCR